MLVWIFAAVAIALAGLFLLWSVHHSRRLGFYRELADKRCAVAKNHPPVIHSKTPLEQLRTAFKCDFLVRDHDFVAPETLETLRTEALGNLERGIRSYIPTHKKGRSLPYESVHFHAPACLGFYHSSVIHDWVSAVVGEQVYPAGDHDQSACSILFYDQAGDHINWHFDHNFYRGRQFTLLLSLVNKTPEGGVSASRLMHRKGEQVIEVDSSENSLILFEGSRVLHRVSPTNPGDLRIMLSMTYNTQPHIGRFWEFCRRCKDVAFHGLKVLWN